MTKRMLIDAAHTDETRVALLDNDQVYDYDFVSSSKSQIKGNIYLAKITRVEPSLQAAFVEYGGGKQGFLPFSEIHPDYYQLPQNDKQKLLEEQIAEAEAEEAAEEAAFEREQAMRESRGRGRDSGQDADQDEEDFSAEDEPAREPREEATNSEAIIAFTEASMADSAIVAALPMVSAIEMPQDFSADFAESYVQPLHAEGFTTQSDVMPEDGQPHADHALTSEMAENNQLLQPDDALANGETTSEDGEELRGSRGRDRSLHRRYRIQEVVKRNQIVLVQVIKEERGNKGASLTTFISLAGRAAVLMPNSPKGGGISRKITDRETRKRLKEVAAEMRTHRGMSVIIRTAGIDRTKAEIRRDYEYLVTVWNDVRTTTLSSIAPALIYEEGNLIKRSLRDLYTSDVEEVIVEGEDAYKEAKNFMKMLMPSHIGRIKLYKESMPLFAYAGVEDQLAAMVEPQVRLPSGGYLVIHPTEALISIDVNSGRSTTERNVEETAIKTNMEAAYEVARQLRLRDLAGLIVIDFIDMGFGKNRKQVERAMKDALKADRAKIQVGRISMFGLLELSRQRLRPSISESMGIMCPHCKGTGYIHSVETVGIQIIRTLEKEAASGDYVTLRITAHPEAALYLLNEKRAALQALEERYNVHVVILMDAAIITGSQRLVKITSDGREILHEPNNQPKRGSMTRGRRGKRSGNERQGNVINFDGTTSNDEAADAAFLENVREDDDEVLIPAEPLGEEESRDTPSRAPRPRRDRGGRNRRGGERGERRPREQVTSDATDTDAEGTATQSTEQPSADQASGDETSRDRGRRRGRRGGRNRRGNERGERRPREGQEANTTEGASMTEHANSSAASEPAPRYSSEAFATTSDQPQPFAAYEPQRPTAYEASPSAPEPKRSSFVIPLSEKQTNPDAVASPIVSESSGDDKNKRKGWWSRVLES